MTSSFLSPVASVPFGNGSCCKSQIYWIFTFLYVGKQCGYYLVRFRQTNTLSGLGKDWSCFGLLGCVTLNMAGKYPDIQSKISCFVATNTAGKCYNIASKISSFVVANTAGECPDVASEISSVFTFTNAETPSLTVASRLAAVSPGHHPLYLLTSKSAHTGYVPLNVIWHSVEMSKQ